MPGGITRIAGVWLALAAFVLALPAHAGDQVIVAWGNDTYGQCQVPVGTGFTRVAAGAYHDLGLKTDGAIIA